MSPPPPHPKVYHITHMKNLTGIVADQKLLCDAKMIARGGPVQAIGMSAIKKRRVEEIEVGTHPDTKVGDYVPFYFCPRSVMLYVIHRGNHPELTYHDGQGLILHLEADLHRVIRWAEAKGRRWAFSLSNAGAYYTEFRSRPDELDQLDWKAIAAADFRDPDVKEGKQAEFLVHKSFPFDLVDRIGVCSAAIQLRVAAALVGSGHRPPIEVHPEWYF
jgi:hypothetical protein